MFYAAGSSSLVSSSGGSHAQFVFCVQAALMKDAAISVNRCLWSPDGTILGMEWLISVLLNTFGHAFVLIRHMSLWHT
jgi:hypothetical protein